MRMCFEGLAGKVASIHPTQVYVREQHVNNLFSEDDVGLLGTGGGQEDETRLLECLDCHTPDKQVILDNKNAAAACLWEPALRLWDTAPER